MRPDESHHENLDPQLLAPLHAQPRSGSVVGLPSRQNTINDEDDDGDDNGDGNTSKRRKLNLRKCKQCRSARKKCFPEDREWPEKCKRCLNHRPPLECSPPEINVNKRGPNRSKALDAPGTKELSPFSRSEPGRSKIDNDSSDDDKAPLHRPTPTLPARAIKREHSEITKGPSQKSGFHEFNYRPLRDDQFRIMMLYPGRKDERVVCEFEEWSKKDYKSYEVVSYLWDDGSKNKPDLEMDLRDPYAPNNNRTITLKHTVVTALQSLRHYKEKKAFWVEALCINRPDHGERQRQIEMKSYIISHAYNLCLWLGDDPIFKRAFNFIPRIVDLTKIDDLIKDRESLDDWAAFVELMGNPVFRRLWLLYEVTLAPKKRVTLHSKQQAIHYADFVDAVSMFASRREELSLLSQKAHDFKGFLNTKISTTERFVDVTTNALRMATSPPSGSRIAVPGYENLSSKDIKRGFHPLMSVEELVSQLSDLGSGNPRDRIFAVLALAKDTHDKPNLLPISYTKPTFEIYQQFVEHAVGTSKSLDIICRRWASAPEPTDPHPLPSWITISVTDANTTERTDADSLVGLPRQKNYDACASRPPSYRFARFNRAQKNLYAHGFVLDYVEKLAPRASNGTIMHEWLKFGGHYIDGGIDYVPEAFWKTLVADRGHNGRHAPAWYYRALLYCLVESPVDGDIDTNEIIKRCETSQKSARSIVEFLRRVQAVIWNKKFLISQKKELFGLAPSVAEVGDAIVVLYGCSVPVILRPVRGETWKFIGECYVHGMMDGEALETSEAGKEFIREFDIE